MADPVIVKLRKPITFGGRVIDQLAIRPLKAKDLRKMRDSDSATQSALRFAANLSGEIDEVIDELEGDDLGEVIAVVNGFFLRLRAHTGDSSSDS